MQRDSDDDDRSSDREDGPLEEQIERLQEKVESAQSEQKNLFLVIFQVMLGELSSLQALKVTEFTSFHVACISGMRI